MSYVRFGGPEQSAVYVFRNMDGYLDCHNCSLLADKARFRGPTASDDLISHLHAHLRAGQVVPQEVLDYLDSPKDRAEVQAFLRKRA